MSSPKDLVGLVAILLASACLLFLALCTSERGPTSTPRFAHSVARKARGPRPWQLRVIHAAESNDQLPASRVVRVTVSVAELKKRAAAQAVNRARTAFYVAARSAQRTGKEAVAPDAGRAAKLASARAMERYHRARADFVAARNHFLALSGKAPVNARPPTSGRKTLPPHARAAAEAVNAAGKAFGAARAAVQRAHTLARRPNATDDDRKKAQEASNAFKYARERLVAAQNHFRDTVNKKPKSPVGGGSGMNKNQVTVKGKRLPLSCYCARAPPAESSCYDFAEGSDTACERRKCSPSFLCVGRSKSKGATCFLRRVRKRIIATGRYTCAKKSVNSYMYVPYAK